MNKITKTEYRKANKQTLLSYPSHAIIDGQYRIGASTRAVEIHLIVKKFVSIFYTQYLNPRMKKQ